MPAGQKAKVKSIMAFYTHIVRTGVYGDFSWTTKRKRFTLQQANAFFLGVLLDQGQKAERAWEGAEHLVENYFYEQIGFWNTIRKTHHQSVRSICRTGYEGTSYASVFCTNKFPKWLRSAAIQMGEEYDDDPRNIWNVSPNNVEQIYDRFVEFEGIGDALGKMAQFILVRNYGIAGGKSNEHKMSVKPDVLVRRVVDRCGLSGSGTLRDVLGAISDLHLKRPVDFDAATWVIGREFCLKTYPRCTECPIGQVCSYASAQQGAAPDRYSSALHSGR